MDESRASNFYAEVVLEAEKEKGFWELEEAYRILKKIGEIINEDADLKADWRMDGVDLYEACICDFQTYTFSKVLREIYYAECLKKRVNPNELRIFRSKGSCGLKSINYLNIFYKAVDFLGRQKGIRVRIEGKSGLFNWIRQKFVLFARPYLKTFYNFVRYLIIHREHRETVKGDVWFFNNLGRTLDTVLPVAQELKKRGIEPIILQYSDDGSARLKDSEVKAVRLEGLTGIRDILGWLFWAIKVKRMVRRLLSDDKIKASLISCGVPLVVVAAKELETGMRMTLEGIYPMSLWLKRSGCFNGKAIVSTSDRSNFCRFIAFMAKEKNIPFIALQNGILPDHPKWLPELICDSIAVEGEQVLKILTGKGHNTEKLVITGQPKYDVILRKYKPEKYRANICEKYSLNPEKKIVLYASNQMNESVSQQAKAELGQNVLRENEFSAVYALPLHLKEIQLIVKPHPNEELNTHERLLGEVSHLHVRLAPKTEDAYALIAASDLVIIHRSTVGLDALVLGKQLIVFNLTGEEDMIPYVKYGAAVGVYDKMSLLMNVKNLLINKNNFNKKLKTGRDHFIKDYAFMLDGKASSRMADVIIGEVQR